MLAKDDARAIEKLWLQCFARKHGKAPGGARFKFTVRAGLSVLATLKVVPAIQSCLSFTRPHMHLIFTFPSSLTKYKDCLCTLIVGEYVATDTALLGTVAYCMAY